MFAEELRALSVPEAKEYHVAFVERQFVGEAHVGFAEQSLVHVAEQVACIARAVHECYFRLGVVKKNAAQFAGGVACAANYSYSYHGLSFGMIIQHSM